MLSNKHINAHKSILYISPKTLSPCPAAWLQLTVSATMGTDSHYEKTGFIQEVGSLQVDSSKKGMLNKTSFECLICTVTYLLTHRH